MVLWICPNGCAAKRGPERPRRTASVRYCLACSARSDTLVERRAPALDRARSERAAKAAQLRASAKSRQAASDSARTRVTGEWGTIDLTREWARIWETQRGRDARVRPKLRIRRSAKDGRWSSGHAYSWEEGGNTVVTVGQGHPEFAIALLLHEAAHVLCPRWTRHGPAWRDAFVALAAEAYGVKVLDPGGSSHHLHEQVVRALNDSRGGVLALIGGA